MYPQWPDGAWVHTLLPPPPPPPRRLPSPTHHHPPPTPTHSTPTPTHPPHTHLHCSHAVHSRQGQLVPLRVHPSPAGGVARHLCRLPHRLRQLALPRVPRRRGSRQGGWVRAQQVVSWESCGASGLCSLAALPESLKFACRPGHPPVHSQSYIGYATQRYSYDDNNQLKVELVCSYNSGGGGGNGTVAETAAFKYSRLCLTKAFNYLPFI